jgi:hypothetical protein
MYIVTQGPSYSIQPIQLDHTYTILASHKKKKPESISGIASLYAGAPQAS